MKIFITTDMEGICGISNWEDARSESASYPRFAERYTREAVAACEGAIQAGATDILVRDGHGSARNLNPYLFPEGVRLVCGWGGHPYSMMEGLDETFDAVAYVGYHCAASRSGNPLAHTISSRKIASIKINGVIASEFYINQFIANEMKVPSVFLSGDQAICSEAQSLIAGLRTVVASTGSGNAAFCNNPLDILMKITETMRLAVQGRSGVALLGNPEKFVTEITYLYHADAYHASFYPGVESLDAKTNRFTADGIFELMRTLKFVI